MNLNKSAVQIAKKMVKRREELKINSFKLGKATVIDCGVEAKGSLEAGRLFALACMGGAADIEILSDSGFALPCVTVRTNYPAVACLASQKAGWSIKGEKFFALGSGPARILARKPRETFEKLGYGEKSSVALLALETSKFPSEAVASEIARACGIDARGLYILAARTASLVGSVQISSRAVETALFKLAHLGCDARVVEEALGTAPIAPVVGDDCAMMGAANDMIIYGSRVFLYSRGEIDAEKLPSSTSPAYGKPFSEIYKECGYDFYKINPALFAPAEVFVNDLAARTLKKAGSINLEVIKKSIGIA